MFINNETGRPAWLIEQDTDVVFCMEPPSVRSRHHIVTSSFEFFSRHREATADDLAAIEAGQAAPTVTMPMQQPQPNAPTVTPAGLADPPAKSPAAKTRSPAKKKPAAKKKAAPAPKAEKPPAEKPPADKSADKAPAAEKPADQDGEKSPPPPGAGPHGEQGRD